MFTTLCNYVPFKGVMACPEEQQLIGHRESRKDKITRAQLQNNQQSYVYLTLSKILAIICLVGTLYLSYNNIKKSPAQPGTDLNDATVFEVQDAEQDPAVTIATDEVSSDQFFTLLKGGMFIVKNKKEEENIRHNYGYLKPISYFTPFNRTHMKLLSKYGHLSHLS